MDKFTDLEKILNVKFKKKSLLKQALTHRSYLNENPDFSLGHNERLEFLGDAVLEIIVTEHLFDNFPDTPEGELTNWRASLVNSKMLYKVAREIKIEDLMLLSKGESKDRKSKARQYILANAVEAIIGAIYLDQGIKVASQFVQNFIISNLKEILDKKLYLDSKSKFQERAQEKVGITPRYRVLSESGPDHEKSFEIGAFLGEEMVSTGKGLSKQEAETEAARIALQKKGWDK